MFCVGNLDLILVVLWLVFVVTGLTIQYVTNRGRPPFPSAPSPVFKRMGSILVETGRRARRQLTPRRNGLTDPLVDTDPMENESPLGSTFGRNSATE